MPYKRRAPGVDPPLWSSAAMNPSLPETCAIIPSSATTVVLAGEPFLGVLLTCGTALVSASRLYTILPLRSPNRCIDGNHPDTVGEVGGTPPKACIPRLPAWARQLR